MASDPSKFLPVALFGTLAIVAAFAVSAIAGLGGGGEGPDATGAHPANAPAPRDADTPVHADIRVEVLNGAGRAGLARDGTGRLREVGFDVVFFGNAGRFDHGRSFVLDRLGDPARARAVAAALGIDSIAAAVDSTLLLDVTVVLGADWPPLVPERKAWTERAREWLARDSVP